MKTFLLLTLTAIFSTSGLLACTVATTETIPPLAQTSPLPVKKTMKAFSSDEELKRYFKELAKKSRGQAKSDASNFTFDAPEPTAANKAVAGLAKEAEESVTNTQHAGVDEGGIVKVHGDHLVVLRRGRLFTVAIGDQALKPISNIDAFSPDVDPRSTWYD